MLSKDVREAAPRREARGAVHEKQQGRQGATPNPNAVGTSRPFVFLPWAPSLGRLVMLHGVLLREEEANVAVATRLRLARLHVK